MQIDGLEIPKEWLQLLYELKTVSPHAVLAGGAIRDLHYGTVVKDLDFFASSSLWPTKWGEPLTDAFDYEGMKHVQAVLTFGKINLIVVDEVSVEDLIKSFDFGFCQIAFDGEKFIKTPAFDWDFKQGVITLHHTDRYPRSVRRYARWLGRYNMDISIPAIPPEPKLDVF